MKRYITITFIAALSLAVSSCKDWLDINTNPNYPTSVDVSSLLPTVQMRTAEKVGYELALVGSFWSQYIVQYGSSNQYYTIMTGNLNNSASYFTAPWSVFYMQNLPSIKEMLTEYDGVEGKENLAVEAKTMLAYNLYLLTSLYDQVCYTESFKTDTYRTTEGNFNPKFDSGEETQANIIALLEEIRALDPDAVSEAEDNNSSASIDMVFGGDAEAWLQFANTLYLKMLMRDFSANRTKIQAVLAEDNLLAKDAVFDNYEDKPDKSNPLYESDQRQLNTRMNIRACADALDTLQSVGDARLAVYYTIGSNGTYNGTSYGVQGGRTTSQLNMKADDPVYFSTADEAYFLKAEAYARLGNASAAKTNYEAGVRAAFSRTGCSGADALLAADYAFTATAEEAMVEQILFQKWLANIKALPIESWFDLNRTGYPQRGVTITDYTGILGAGKYPYRFMYSRTSALYNENSPEPQPITEKMWWHK